MERRVLGRGPVWRTLAPDLPLLLPQLLLPQLLLPLLLLPLLLLRRTLSHQPCMLQRRALSPPSRRLRSPSDRLVRDRALTACRATPTRLILRPHLRRRSCRVSQLCRKMPPHLLQTLPRSRVQVQVTRRRARRLTRCRAGLPRRKADNISARIGAENKKLSKSDLEFSCHCELQCHGRQLPLQ